jgi:predicted MFS family arabinose efflux permease
LQSRLSESNLPATPQRYGCARVYGLCYVVSFSALAAALPLIAFVHDHWGFDTLFRILAAAAAVILLAVALLPRKLPTPAAVGA